MQVADEIVKSWADLTVYGDHLNFDALTAGLGVEPSVVHLRGSAMRSGERFPHDMWSLHSPLERSEPLDTHLAWLQAVLSPCYGYARSLNQHARLVIHCWVQSFDNSLHFSITPERMIMFTEIGVPWGISAILWGRDSEEEARVFQPVNSR